MSGWSAAEDCPRCGSKESLECSGDRRDAQGFCSECGYIYYVVHEVATLEAVNEERIEFEMEPITELKKPVEGWKDEEKG